MFVVRCGWLRVDRDARVSEVKLGLSLHVNSAPWVASAPRGLNGCVALKFGH